MSTLEGFGFVTNPSILQKRVLRYSSMQTVMIQHGRYSLVHTLTGAVTRYATVLPAAAHLLGWVA